MARQKTVLTLIMGVAWVSGCGSAHGQQSRTVPFAWSPSYSNICRANNRTYACRVIADGDELYTNIPSVDGLFHFSLVGKSKACGGGTSDQASCGTLLMVQPNNGRDVINFAYKKTKSGWILNEINNDLGGPNEHLKLSIPIPTEPAPKCKYNGIQEPCIILTGKKEAIQGYAPSSNYAYGYGFQLIYIRNWRGKQSYDTVLYQAVGPTQKCEPEKDCQTGRIRIFDTKRGYEHITQASYRVSNDIWSIKSALGNQLTISLDTSSAMRN